MTSSNDLSPDSVRYHDDSITYRPSWKDFRGPLQQVSVFGIPTSDPKDSHPGYTKVVLGKVTLPVEFGYCFQYKKSGIMFTLVFIEETGNSSSVY